jgi:hypothetical protein
MNKKKLALFAIIPTLGLAAVASSAFAASGTSTSTVSAVITKAFGGRGNHGQKDSTQFATDLASVLGLSATDVKAKLAAGTPADAIITASGKTKADVDAALKTLRETSLKAKIAADVASGKLTQVQADQMIANIAHGTFGHAGGPGKGHGSKDSTQFATDLASVLGLSATDVKVKLDAGQTPASIITAAGKTESDVMTQMKTLREASMKARLAAAVTAGTMTQAEADAIIAHEATETHDGHRGGSMGRTSTPPTTTSTQ